MALVSENKVRAINMNGKNIAFEGESITLYYITRNEIKNGYGTTNTNEYSSWLWFYEELRYCNKNPMHYP